MATDKDIEAKLRDIRFKTSPELDRRIRCNVIAAGYEAPTSDCSVELNGRIRGHDVTAPGAGHDRAPLSSAARRAHIFSARRRVAASVLLSAGIVVLVVMLLGQRTGVALAEVIAKAAQAESVTFVQQVKSEHLGVLEIKGYMQGEALRCELSNGIVYVENQKERKGLFLDKKNKKAVRYNFPTDAVPLSLWQTDPIQWLQQVKPADAKPLGKETLDGKRVETFSATRVRLFTGATKSYGFPPEHTVKIWVERQTELPLKIEIRDPQGIDVMAFAQIEWNERLGSELFVLDVPEGFTVESLHSFRSRLPQSTGRVLEKAPK